MNILSLSVLSFFILTCSALFFPKKGFIFVSLLPEKSWGKGVQTGKGEKSDHRERKRSFDAFGERGIDGRRAEKVRQ